MSNFDWERLRDCMMEYDQNEAYKYVYEVVTDIIENEGFKLGNLSIKEIKEIINIGLGILYQFYGEELGRYAEFNHIMMIGITEMLYRKYPEVKKKWNGGIWIWKWS